jgi:cell division septum initiation protein DivIVA
LPTSVNIRQSIAEVLHRRAKVDQDIAAAELRKATNETEAARKHASALRSSSPSQAQTYERQAEAARNTAYGDAKRIADLLKKRADLLMSEARHTHSLADALKRELADAKREMDRTHRAREQSSRRP